MSYKVKHDLSLYPGLVNNGDYRQWVEHHVLGSAERAFDEAGGQDDCDGLWGDPYSVGAERQFLELGFRKIPEGGFSSMTNRLIGYIVHRTFDDHSCVSLPDFNTMWRECVGDNDKVDQLIVNVVRHLHAFVDPEWPPDLLTKFQSSDAILSQVEYDVDAVFHALEDHCKDVYTDLEGDYYRVKTEGNESSLEHVTDFNGDFREWMERNYTFSIPEICSKRFVTETFAINAISAAPWILIHNNIFQSNLHVWARNTCGQQARQDEEVQLSYIEFLSETERKQLSYKLNTCPQ